VARFTSTKYSKNSLCTAHLHLERLFPVNQQKIVHDSYKDVLYSHWPYFPLIVRFRIVFSSTVKSQIVTEDEEENDSTDGRNTAGDSCDFSF